MKAYEIIEHTADIGIKSFGDTVSEAFSNAAKGMFDIITDHSDIDSKALLEFEEGPISKAIIRKP